jgi:hypothetical protein
MCYWFCTTILQINKAGCNLGYTEAELTTYFDEFMYPETENSTWSEKNTRRKW